MPDKPSEAEIEAGAKAIYDRRSTNLDVPRWPHIPPFAREDFRDDSRACLIAAAKARIGQ